LPDGTGYHEYEFCPNITVPCYRENHFCDVAKQSSDFGLRTSYDIRVAVATINRTRAELGEMFNAVPASSVRAPQKAPETPNLEQAQALPKEISLSNVNVGRCGHDVCRASGRSPSAR
jgi:hypothetical protein